MAGQRQCPRCDVSQTTCVRDVSCVRDVTCVRDVSSLPGLGEEEEKRARVEEIDVNAQRGDVTIMAKRATMMVDEKDVVVVRATREIRELFRTFDKNHDNTISAGELGKVLRCLGMNVSEQEVQTIMKELDKNGNGKIEYKEFKAFMQDQMRRAEEPAEQEKAIRMAFRVFDQNGDGFIDVQELKHAMKNLGEPLTDKELQDMMKEADVDRNNKIDYEEFIRVWINTGKK